MSSMSQNIALSSMYLSFVGVFFSLPGLPQDKNSPEMTKVWPTVHTGLITATNQEQDEKYCVQSEHRDLSVF